VRVREGYFGSEGGESSQGTRGFLSHLVTARCQSSRHSRIPSSSCPGRDRQEFGRGALVAEQRMVATALSHPLDVVPWGDRRESGRGASNAEFYDVCCGILASLKARASGGTGESSAAGSSAAEQADDRHGTARC